MSTNTITAETVSEIPNFAAAVSSKEDSNQATEADAEPLQSKSKIAPVPDMSSM